MLGLNILRRYYVLIFLISLSVLSSCEYDNYDDLKVDGNPCDTLNMTYTDDISPIIDQSCISCHSGPAPAANIPLETYDDVESIGKDGSLYGSVNHILGWSSMPKNEAKLSDCNLSKINSWIDGGMPK